MLPLFTFLFNPVIGTLVDCFQNIKGILIVLSITSSLAYISIACLSASNYDMVDPTFMRISFADEPEALIKISKPFERSCLEKNLRSNSKCLLGLEGKNGVLHSNNLLDVVINKTFNVEPINYFSQAERKSRWITFYAKDKFPFDEDYTINSVDFQCFPPIHQCCLCKEQRDILPLFHFWIFFTLVTLAFVSNHSAHYLTHVAYSDLLGTNSKEYGSQRLFGIIGRGIVGALAGCLNDYFEKRFSFIICVIVIFQIADIIILSIIPLSKTRVSCNMTEDLSVLFFSTEILVLTFGVVAGGFLHAIIDVFKFWFLDDIGASRTLLGLSTLVQCLVGEIPTFFVSGWILKKVRYFLCFTCIFVGYLLCLNLYFLLKNPWLALPINILHGAISTLSHDTMTSFAKEKAPKVSEAALLTLFGGLCFASGM